MVKRHLQFLFRFFLLAVVLACFSAPDVLGAEDGAFEKNDTEVVPEVQIDFAEDMSLEEYFYLEEELLPEDESAKEIAEAYDYDEDFGIGADGAEESGDFDSLLFEEVIENPDDKACHFWLTCPACNEQFEVNNGYTQS